MIVLDEVSCVREGDDELRVKETMKWINCWRAGVMSRHEEEEEEGLLT